MAGTTRDGQGPRAGGASAIMATRARRYTSGLASRPRVVGRGAPDRHEISMRFRTLPTLLAGLFVLAACSAPAPHTPPPPAVLVQPVMLDYGALAEWIGWVGGEAGIDNAKRILARPGTFRLDIHFLEPFHPRDFPGRKAITAEARRRIEEALVANRDLLPDIMAQAKKIAAMAEIFNAEMAPHLYAGPVEWAANIHLSASIPNLLIAETIETGGAFHQKLIKNSIRWEDGYIIPPETPGLGIDFDEDVARAHPYTGTALHLQMQEAPCDYTHGNRFEGGAPSTPT